jgi:hypothetical protein
VDVLGAVACGVDAVLIQHARVVDEAVRSRAWRTVRSPVEAFELLLEHTG